MVPRGHIRTVFDGVTDLSLFNASTRRSRTDWAASGTETRQTGDYSATRGDVPSEPGPNEKNSNLGGRKPAFHSSVFVEDTSNVTSKKNEKKKSFRRL